LNLTALDRVVTRDHSLRGWLFSKRLSTRWGEAAICFSKASKADPISSELLFVLLLSKFYLVVCFLDKLQEIKQHLYEVLASTFGIFAPQPPSLHPSHCKSCQLPIIIMPGPNQVKWGNGSHYCVITLTAESTPSPAEDTSSSPSTPTTAI
ncbi:hypothetical protein H4Q26_018401, partial [Puccinia striiformis f. sp. tritici PST-130]